MITFPDRATHCKLKLGVAALDFENDKFVFATRESAEIPKDKNLTALQTLTAQLPANVADPVILALGIDFIEQEGQFLYPVRNSMANPMKLIAVDIPA